MNTESLLDGSERFLTHPTVQDALAVIEGNLASINEDLSYASPEYDSIMAFSHSPGETVAAPLGHSDAYNTSRTRHEFRNTNIIGRNLLLKGTSLGDSLSRPKPTPHFAASAINTDHPQLVYTQPLFAHDKLIGALQSSYSPTENSGVLSHIPEERTLEKIFLDHQPELNEIAHTSAQLQELGRLHGSLGTALEYQPPIAPNALVVRWDVAGSKAYATGEQNAVLTAYLNQAHRRVRAVAQGVLQRYDVDQWSIKDVYDDQGDGSNIVIPLRFNTYDAAALKRYTTHHAEPFIEAVRTELEQIGKQYPRLHPTIRIDSELSYVEPNSIGRLGARAMFALGAQKTK